MADKRLKNIDINKAGWIDKYDSIISSINNFYQDTADVPIQLYSELMNFHELGFDDAIIEFRKDLIEVYKYFPWLLAVEEYEIMGRAEKTAMHLLQEKQIMIEYYMMVPDMTKVELKNYLLQEKVLVYNMVMERFENRFDNDK